MAFVLRPGKKEGSEDEQRNNFGQGVGGGTSRIEKQLKKERRIETMKEKERMLRSTHFTQQ